MIGIFYPISNKVFGLKVYSFQGTMSWCKVEQDDYPLTSEFYDILIFFKLTKIVNKNFKILTYNILDVIAGEEPESDQRRAARIAGRGHAAVGAVPQHREPHFGLGKVGRLADQLSTISIFDLITNH